MTLKHESLVKKNCHLIKMYTKLTSLNLFSFKFRYLPWLRTVHFLDSWRHFEVSCLIWCSTVVSVFASHCSLCNSSCKVGLGSSWKFFWRLWPGYRRALEEVAWSNSYKIQCYTLMLKINGGSFVWWFISNIIKIFLLLQFFLV